MFPVIASWKDFCSNESEDLPKLPAGEQIVDSLHSLTLPSKRTTARRNRNMILRLTYILGFTDGPMSFDDDQNVTETLFLAITTPPLRRSDQDFLSTFKSHYDQPEYQFLRLIRLSRIFNHSQPIDMYIVICDSRELRYALKEFLLSQSSSKDASPWGPELVSRGNSPVSLVRSSKQHVLNRLCHNLDCLKFDLEEAVRAPYSVECEPSKG